MNILIKALSRNNFDPSIKKGQKYYKLQAKQKALDLKNINEERLKKINQSRKVGARFISQTPQVNLMASSPIEQTSPATLPKFAVNTYVSITPDTSQRGYKCNRIQGIVCALNR